jgi:hypothetical protein
MIERIKAIAERSGIEYGSAVKCYYSHCTDGVQEDDMIKFARLIVEECCAAIDDGNGEASSIAENCWRQQCIREIKKHFEAK